MDFQQNVLQCQTFCCFQCNDILKTEFSKQHAEDMTGGMLELAVLMVTSHTYGSGQN